jgi:hypothetical protein
MRKSIAVIFCLLILIALACTSSQMLQPLSPFEQTRAALISTATAYAFVPSQSVNQAPIAPIDSSADPFSLTATSIIATATAGAWQQDNACRNVQIITQFNYSSADNYQEPHISEDEWATPLCNDEWKPPYRYEIIINSYNLAPVPKSRLIPVLEDAVSRLTDYPPFNGDTSSTVMLMSYLQRGTMVYTDFTYVEAIAAYESGLRGEDLARELGLDDNIDLTATVVLREAVAYETARAKDFELRSTADASVRTATANASLPLPTVNATREAEFMTGHALPTLSNDEIRQTQVTIVETATAIVPYIPMTQAAQMASSTSDIATQNALATLGIDYYGLTATPLVATFNAYASVSPTPCEGFDWTYVYFNFGDVRDSGISEQTTRYCFGDDEILYSHVITLFYTGRRLNQEQVNSILEYIVSELPSYPPKHPKISEAIEMTNLVGEGIWTFSYSDALAAYESGLRGADLAEALGVAAP